MALVLLDRAKETTIVVGTTVSAILLGAAPGYQSLAGVGNGNTTYYCIADQSGGVNWEVGLGTYTLVGTTITRAAAPLSSSNAGASVSFPAGTKDVFIVYPSSKGIWLDASGNAIGLGTPAAFVATNVTGLPLTTGVSGTLSVGNGGTGVTTSTGSGNNVLSTSPTLVTPALGTPSALVGTNITGTATAFTASNVTTNANLTGAVTSVGNATSLGSFTSLQLLTALTDQTGTGVNVFATSPTLVTPALGTPSALVGTNITGTATNFTATRVTTNANLTGAVTSVGNASLLGSFTSLQLLTALTDQTGTGANVFAVSPAFTGVPTAPTAVVGTNTTQIATTANVYASSIGQTWTDVTTTRALSTTYTNSTGRTIAINYWTGGSATASSSFVVNGVTIYVCTNNTAGGVINSGAGWIVSPGDTYRILANVALTKWFELR